MPLTEPGFGGFRKINHLCNAPPETSQLMLHSFNFSFGQIAWVARSASRVHQKRGGHSVCGERRYPAFLFSHSQNPVYAHLQWTSESVLESSPDEAQCHLDGQSENV